MRRRAPGEGYNFWPCVSDLMLACFAFMLLLWISQQLRATKVADDNGRLRDALAAVTAPADAIATAPPPAPPKDWKPEYDSAMVEVARLRKRPPILNFREAEGYSFDSGRANLSQEFDANFEGVIKQLKQACDEYQGVVDTIEVIGHTDQQRVSGTLSDLDLLLVPAVDGKTPLEKIRFASNVELGLLRAVAVMQRIRAAQADQRLPPLPVHAYSAAQLVASSNDASGDPKNRRRIEIRLARLKASSSPAPVETR